MLAVLTDLADLAVPRRCVGCGRPGRALCPDCVGDAAVREVDCAPLSVWAAAAYRGGVGRAVVHYKERGRRDLAGPLAVLLARAVSAVPGSGCPAPLLVSVPSSRAAVAGRGGDHMTRLARRAAAMTGLRHAPGVLVLNRAVRDSAGLGAVERARNMSGAMSARAAPGRLALVVDDVVTTGATLREARRALVAAGWSVAGAAVVAATPAPNERAGHATGIVGAQHVGLA